MEVRKSPRGIAVRDTSSACELCKYTPAGRDVCEKPPATELRGNVPVDEVFRKYPDPELCDESTAAKVNGNCCPGAEFCHFSPPAEGFNISPAAAAEGLNKSPVVKFRIQTPAFGVRNISLAVVRMSRALKLAPPTLSSLSRMPCWISLLPTRGRSKNVSHSGGATATPE